MTQEVTRHIKHSVQTTLWGRSAGRCQFNGCNKPLYKSPVTQEPVNIAEKAHIYSFSENGPRGWGPFIINRHKINEIDNLMLMCHDCHKTIDTKENTERYSAELLKKWKKEHEERIWITSGISPENKTEIILYGANIGEQKSPLQYSEAVGSIFPHKFPAREGAISISMHSSLEDKDSTFWQAEEEHLKTIFQQQVLPKIENGKTAHFSIFALAPIPLLIKLGTLLTDKISVDIYQPIREPKGWIWQDKPDDFSFEVDKPKIKQVNNKPVLVLSLSAHIDRERVKSVLGQGVDVWEIKPNKGYQHNDFIKSPEQLSMFRSEIRKLLETINSFYGIDNTLYIFPAMPVSTAIEMGRVRMPKASMEWKIYDQNRKSNAFIEALTI